MPYEFTEWEDEPVAEASSARSGVPPRKHTGIGVLDPAGPLRRPKGPVPPLAPIPTALVLRFLSAALLIGLAVLGSLMILQSCSDVLHAN